MKKAFLIIDPQNDFCDPHGSLSVAGAELSSELLHKFIQQNLASIDAIFTTLDSHYAFHIAHPSFWQDADGQAPSPFSIIEVEDIKSGKYKARVEAYADWALHYVEELSKQNKYKLCIWPEHCLVGSWGHSIHEPIFTALQAWEHSKPSKLVEYIRKGTNPKTEHYSAFKAEVLDEADPTSKLNFELIKKLDKFDEIFVGGQALSHCVANSLYDLIEHIEPSKIILLSDTTNPVTGFEKEANDFLEKAKTAGIKIRTTIDA